MGTCQCTCFVGEYDGEIENDTVKVTAVTLEKTAVTLKKGESAVLKATVAPENATNKTVIWTSSNNSVVKVENGVITAIAAGQAFITAAAGDKSVVCNITVTEEDGSEIVTPPVTGTDLPERQGAMTWSINWEASNNYKFANTMAECFAKLPSGSEGQTLAVESANADIAETTVNTTETTTETTEKTEPPYPFWKDYKNYPEKIRWFIMRGRFIRINGTQMQV